MCSLSNHSGLQCNTFSNAYNPVDASTLYDPAIAGRVHTHSCPNHVISLPYQSTYHLTSSLYRVFCRMQSKNLLQCCLQSSS